MTPALKLVRDLVDRRVAQTGDPDLVAMIAAERAAADAIQAAADEKPALKLVNKADLKKLLGVKSDRTIEQMVSDGKIPPTAVVKIGRRVRFDVANVIDALRGKGAAESRGAAWARRKNTLRLIDGGT